MDDQGGNNFEPEAIHNCMHYENGTPLLFEVTFSSYHSHAKMELNC